MLVKSFNAMAVQTLKKFKILNEKSGLMANAFKLDFFVWLIKLFSRTSDQFRAEQFQPLFHLN